MLSKDHRLLGEYLAGQMIENTSPLAIRLFIKGCVFPDHNPWTYLRGVFMGHPFKTHFVFLSYPEIMRLCEKLENRTRLYLWDYYTLGALLHYVADAFTYVVINWDVWMYSCLFFVSCIARPAWLGNSNDCSVLWYVLN